MTTTALKPPSRRSRPGGASAGYTAWLGLSALVCVTITVFAVSAYWTLDVDQSRPDVRGVWHYGLLVTHIFTGTVAVLAGLVQFVPRIRNRHPRVHRYTGRVYLFAGVLPSSVLGLVVAALSLMGIQSSVPLGITAVLWFVTAVQGLRAARDRDFRAHRVWMIRNFALTTAAVTGRLWGLTLAFTVGGDYVFVTANWLALFGNLLIAEWWIQRTNRTAPVLAAPQVA